MYEKYIKIPENTSISLANFEELEELNSFYEANFWVYFFVGMLPGHNWNDAKKKQQQNMKFTNIKNWKKVKRFCLHICLILFASGLKVEAVEGMFEVLEENQPN